MVVAANLKNPKTAISRRRFGWSPWNLACWRSSTLLTVPNLKCLKI